MTQDSFPQKGIYHIATDTFVYPIMTKNHAEECCDTCPSCGEMTHLEGHEEGQYYQSQCNNGTCNKFGMTQKFPYTTPSTS